METSTMLVELGAMHTVLAAEGRSPEIPEEMDLYGWAAGSWELWLKGYDDNSNVIYTTGEAHFGWVLEGRAVQDVFINPRRSERGEDSAKFANWFGTTLRIYDASIVAWRVNWFNPHDGMRAELIGRRQGKDIVQEGAFPDGTPIRWTFSEIILTDRKTANRIKFFGQPETYYNNYAVGVMFSTQDGGRPGWGVGWHAFMLGPNGQFEIPLTIRKDTYIFETSAESLGNPTSFDWAVVCECDPVPHGEETNRTLIVPEFVPDHGMAHWPLAQPGE